MATDFGDPDKILWYDTNGHTMSPAAMPYLAVYSNYRECWQHIKCGYALAPYPKRNPAARVI